MGKPNVLSILVLTLVFSLSGCVVRTYQSTRDRIDQDLSGGNRGYLKGQMPASESQKEGERKTTRNTQVVEIELQPLVKFEKKKPETPAKPMGTTATEESPVVGNRGYITESISPETAESSGGALEKYTVQKNDTLQKISQKFYGTTKKWIKIYDANKDTMKGPNKIYPGQVISIPDLPSTEKTLKEPAENLK